MDNQAGKDRNRPDEQEENIGQQQGDRSRTDQRGNIGQQQGNPAGTSGRDADLQKEGNLGNERNRSDRTNQDEQSDMGNKPGQNK
ncbi:MAG: hypothetical protein DMF84_29685 [Acidobacteria bacterium]|nr:MAG: hypothetical protein DMF84_29685 [Acidobacteriota bacterium]